MPYEFHFVMESGIWEYSGKNTMQEKLICPGYNPGRWDTTEQLTLYDLQRTCNIPSDYQAFQQEIKMHDKKCD